VRPGVARLSVEIDVLAVDPAAGTLLADAVIRADDLPIYRLDRFAIGAPAPVPRPAPPRATPVAALLDTFTVVGDEGHGALWLDPAVHPWLRDHCPTVAIPALPLAFAAEIAAEAALLLRPGARVVAIPELTATRWIHCGEGPMSLQVVAVAAGDAVAVTLAIGGRAHMTAQVQVGSSWSPAEDAPPMDAPPSDLSVRTYYDGGHTFHGPTLQGLVALDALGPAGARATFATRPDTELLGGDLPAFVLDPLLLDTATHPMMSAEPERWAPVGAGRLAYPVRASNLRFFGPRPTGEVRCTLVALPPTPAGIAFDVHLAGPTAPWAAFRWEEAVVPAGPLLARTPAIRRAFLWDRRGVDAVRVGRADGDRWVVRPADLVEPLPGTIAAVYGTSEERAAVGDQRLAWLAAKEACRTWLRPRIGRDAHPADFVLVPLRPGRWVCLEAPGLSCGELAAHLHPTRIAVWSEVASGAAAAWVAPVADPSATGHVPG
jgi:hypothetical protein